MSGGKISERKGLGQHREEPQPAAAGCWGLTCWQQCGSVTNGIVSGDSAITMGTTRSL